MSHSLVNVTDDLEVLIQFLPLRLQDCIRKDPNLLSLTEIVLDLGYKAKMRFAESDLKEIDYPEITFSDIEKVTQKLRPFNSDNRTGIERTLHRISAIRNRSGHIIGLTCRVGRAVVGTIEIIQDLVKGGKSILFLGRPGIGKTTKLRETARVLADELQKRVMVVDTSNEIAGDGDIPHSGIGSARRMQVPSPDQQHAVMIEAVENHMPEVIIVDEIGTEEETKAARTISQRGVQLIATAHGNTLENLIKNPTLSDLAGGIQTVILGDEEAKFRGTQKSVLERKSMPTFDVLIEIRERDVFAIYPDLASSVDTFLRDEILNPEIRQRDINGKLLLEKKEAEPSYSQKSASQSPLTYVYPYGINIDQLSAAIDSLQLPVIVARSISEADFVVTVKAQVKTRSRIQQILKGRQIPIHIIRANTAASILKFFKNQFKLSDTAEDQESQARREIKRVCEIVAHEKKVTDASPQTSYYRRIQHEYVDSLDLNSLSVGEEPNRYVRVYPRG